MKKFSTILLSGASTCCNGKMTVGDPFLPRHCYEPGNSKIDEMLEVIGVNSMEEFLDETIPSKIRLTERLPLDLEPVGENGALEEMKAKFDKNNVTVNLMGTGYNDTILPSVILRNVLENPAWYTPYTPYQAEISQGRMESLLNFQSMISSLTGMEVANCSLLDSATSAAESLYMAYNIAKGKKKKFYISDKVHPQNIAVVKTKAYPFGIEIVVCDENEFDFDDDVFGCMLQYPDTRGNVFDYKQVIDKAHSFKKCSVVFCTDLMALTRLASPGELGADIVVGDNQRFGISMSFGGPSAGYLACRDELKRSMPGRIIGISKDSNENVALRMALQTREQHIRREKATSNICTASALIANVSAMYAIYHGPEGLKKIFDKIHNMTVNLANNLEKRGHKILNEMYFDTLEIQPNGDVNEILEKAKADNLEFRVFEEGTIGISLNEKTDCSILKRVLKCFGVEENEIVGDECASLVCGSAMERKSELLEHEVFHKYHTEHDLLRYMYRLETKDIALTTCMIPLGSCTMKLNSSSSMIPMTFGSVCGIHPHTDPANSQGYLEMARDLEEWLCVITGFDAVSLQPNSGAQGEYAGVRCIKAYHESRGDFHRNVCLAPISAHGTNPATMTMNGMDIVVVKCEEETGSVDIEDLKAKCEKHAEHLAGMMITYPSTYGIFEEGIMDIIDIVHEHGGQVYMDGANMNAQCGLTNPAFMGADVCHLNLHKTFSVPHGGGGPGVGPIGVKAHLAEFLPNHCCVDGVGGENALGQVASSPFGNAGALPITWMYIRMLGLEGLEQSTKMALLNANYMVKRLENDYKILYRGKNGRVAHEFIIDCRGFEKNSGVVGEDIAKRLMDYGFHAPTLSFPVAGTLMVEPTETESKEELDRYCDALLSIREEIREIEEGKYPKDDNVLKGAPHCALEIAGEWDHCYTREKAAYPIDRLTYYKFWPFVGRVDNPYGDRNFCPNRMCDVDDLKVYDY